MSHHFAERFCADTIYKSMKSVENFVWQQVSLAQGSIDWKPQIRICRGPFRAVGRWFLRWSVSHLRHKTKITHIIIIACKIKRRVDAAVALKWRTQPSGKAIEYGNTASASTCRYTCTHLELCNFRSFFYFSQ